MYGTGHLLWRRYRSSAKCLTGSQPRIAPNIELRLPIELSRRTPVDYFPARLEHFWGQPEFYSIDLYGGQYAQLVESSRSLYRQAKKHGLCLKAQCWLLGYSRGHHSRRGLPGARRCTVPNCHCPSSPSDRSALPAGYLFRCRSHRQSGVGAGILRGCAHHRATFGCWSNGDTDTGRLSSIITAMCWVRIKSYICAGP